MPDLLKSNNITFDNTNNFSVTVNYADTTSESSANVFEHHVHKECEIYINLTGDVYFMVENKIYPIKKGSVVISKPSEYHHCIYNSDCQHKHFCILIDCKRENEIFNLFWKKEKGNNNLIQLSEKQLKKAEDICNRMISGKSSALKNLLDVLTLIQLLNEGQQNKNYVSFDLYSETALAINFINDNYTKNITIKDIADYAHTSISTLERNFKRNLGKTPNNYLKSLRFARSVELLNEGQSVSNACFESGFRDYSLFISLFKKIYGTTPKKYQIDKAKQEPNELHPFL